MAILVTVQEPTATSQQETFAGRFGTADLPNGPRLPCVTQGDPSGVPVVLLHGVTDSWRSWEQVLPHLPDSLHVVAFSHRGHGDADRPSAGYGFEDFARDLEAFLDFHGFEAAVVVGHSMGSAVAQRFAIDHPERVLGLVLVGSATTWRGNPVVGDIWASVVSGMEDPIDPDFVREFQDSAELPRAVLEVAVQESLKAPAHVWRATWQTIVETDHSADLTQIAAPTLIIWGNEDPFCPWSEQQALTAAIADSQLLVYPKAGHNLHWDAPERFAADLVNFVDGLVG